MTKVCMYEPCSKEFHPRAGRPAHDFEKRKFCSPSCASSNKAEVARNRLIEDVEWIVDHDHPHSVAKRVGYGSVDDLMGKLRCNGRPDLADKLSAGVERWSDYTGATA